MTEVTSKVCTRCKVDKPLGEYTPHKLGRFGHAPACKTCMSAASRDYAARNREKVTARKAAYRASPEGKAAAARQWCEYEEKNREVLRDKRIAKYHSTKDEKREGKRATDKQWRDRNKEQVNARRRILLSADANGMRSRAIERSRKWYEANKKAVSDASKQFYQQNRDAVKQRIREYQHANPEQTRLLHRIKAHRRRERLREAGGHFTRQDIENLLVLQRCKCANCHTSLKKGFHIDHREPVAAGGDNGRGNIELLCPTCNIAKSDKPPHEFAQQQGRLI